MSVSSSSSSDDELDDTLHNSCSFSSDDASFDIEFSSSDPSVWLEEQRQKYNPTKQSEIRRPAPRLLSSRHIKEWLTFYTTFSNSVWNQDMILKVLQWSLWLLANTKIGGGKSQQQRPIQLWMNSVSDTISLARYVPRLLGLPMALEAAVNDSWSVDSSEQVYRILGKILSFSMVFYYPLENAAFVQWQRPYHDSDESGEATTATTTTTWTPDRWSRMSCFFWLIYNIAWLTQSVLQWRTFRKQKRDLEWSKKTDTSNCHDPSLKTLAVQIWNAQLNSLRSALLVLPALHYSFSTASDPQRWWTVSSHTVIALMWAEGVLGLYQAIQYQLSNS